MADDDHDLLALLCTRIGTLMEDASVIALTLACQERDRQMEEFRQLDQANRQITALINAAKELL